MSMTVIGKEAIVRGKIRGTGDLEIAGRVEGTIEIQGDIRVVSGALVLCDLDGQVVMINGSVRGDISASESLELGADARVIGNLTAPRIAIEEGAMVRGQVEAGSAPRRAVKPAVKAEVRVPARVAPAAPKASAPQKAALAPQKAATRFVPKPPASLPKLAPKVPLVVKAIPPKKGPGKAPPMVVPVLKKGTKAKRRG
jgi:cytoskeletal protein CcmA (bactofilin family)